jgi:hypothetical protein
LPPVPQVRPKEQPGIAVDARLRARRLFFLSDLCDLFVRQDAVVDPHVIQGSEIDIRRAVLPEAVQVEATAAFVYDVGDVKVSAEIAGSLDDQETVQPSRPVTAKVRFWVTGVAASPGA